MRIFYLMKKLRVSLSTEGLKETLRQLVYVNRIMVVIEKNISSERSLKTKEMHSVVVSATNYQEYQKRFKINLYFCKHGAYGLLLCRGEELLGYQFWICDNSLSILKQLGISLTKGEAYLFNFYVYPQFRGTPITKIVTVEAHNHLISQGINKIYGFYFKDNIKALWWHRANLKCQEIKQVSISRFFIVELSGGKLSINPLRAQSSR